MANLGQFRALVQSLVQTGLQIAGDLNESVIYNSVSSSLYDTISGTTTEAFTTFGVATPLYGIFSKFKADEVDSKVVVSTDAKLSIAYLDLPVTPNVADNLTVIGRTWKPIRVLSVPGSSLWTIHIRVL